MIKNYLKIALRQLRKHKLFSALNIFGLAVSMSVCMLVIMILVDQYGYDDFHEKGDRIFRIISAQEEKGGAIKEPTRATTSLPLAEELKVGYPFVENTCRIASMEAQFLMDGKLIAHEGTGFLVDDGFLDMFTFGWQKGDQGTALQQPRSLLLTEELATHLFGEEEAIGRSIEIGGLGVFTVTGMMPDPPIRSHIYFDYLISFTTVDAMTDKERELVNIQNEFNSTWRGLVYVLLKKAALVFYC